MPLQSEVQVTLEFYGFDGEASAAYRRLYDAATECGVSAVKDFRDDVGASISSASAEGATFYWEFIGSADRIAEFVLRTFQAQ